MKTSEFRKLIREEVRRVLKEGVKSSSRVLKEGVTQKELMTMKGTVGWVANDCAVYDIPEEWPEYIVPDVEVVSFDKGAREVLKYAKDYGASSSKVATLAAKLEKLKTMGNKFVVYGFEDDLNLGVL